MLLIVLFEKDNGVFTLCHLEVCLRGMRASVAKGVCLKSAYGVGTLHGIGVYGDEEVGLHTVGYLRPFVKRHEHVGLACIDHPHIGAVPLHIPPESERDAQVYVFLLRVGAGRAGVLSAVSGIYNEREFLVCPYR